MIIIRQADKEDVPALAALARKTYADAFGHSFTESDLAAHLHVKLSDAYFREAICDDVFFVARNEEGILVGFAQCGDFASDTIESDYCDQELRRLYVLSDFQNKGIGSQLMEVVLLHPRAATAKQVFLDVWERNDAARRLYERFGFVVVGAKKLQIASGVAAERDLVMVRRSAPSARAHPC
jgi:ribosomal protein S18 acetylase RimI-like enzyme